MLRNNYTKMFIRVYVHGSRYKVRRRAISLACTRNIGLREKMRRIFSVYNNEANAPPPLFTPQYMRAILWLVIVRNN